MPRGMLDLKILEQDPDGFKKRLERRGEVAGLDHVLALSQERKALIGVLQEEQAERNQLNAGMKGASQDEIDQKRGAMKVLSTKIKDQEKTLKDHEQRLEDAIVPLPNAPLDEAPEGDNVEVRKVLEPAAFDFEPKDHVELGTSLGLVDFERAAKLSGSRFAALTGVGARLSRAIAQFMLDFHLDLGDLEVAPPLLVGADALVGTGQLPKFGEDLFRVPRGDAGPLYLIPTAEVPLTNFYAGEILDEEQLPIRLVAQTPCFRAEAGAAGKDTRGLIRQHQFDKVEMVRLCTEAQAEAEHTMMVDRASQILEALELPHRVVKLCTGDMGISAELTYDLEVWLPGQNTYREISSCSRCGTYQSLRMKTRYRPSSDGKKKAKPRPIHTLNGSGLAVGRTWLAILENHQRQDGSVAIPASLVPYMGGVEEIRAPK